MRGTEATGIPRGYRGSAGVWGQALVAGQSYHQTYLAALKRRVVDAYGGYCDCCGETEIKFLTVDHRNRDGAAHRRSTNGGKNRGDTTRLYLDIIQSGFPETYRILCANCHIAIDCYRSVCPHQE